MDVELLRPGTVPISPDTILWFEFLLDPNLLQKHLEKPLPDPSPTELITKFHDVINETLRNRIETENNEIVNLEASDEKQKHPAKSIALKIISLKVTASFKWHLSKIMNLPFKTQIGLLQDLLFFTNDNKLVEIPNIEDQDVATASKPYLFALMLFHRWLLNTSMHRIHSNIQSRYGMNDICVIGENIICTPENLNKTIMFLTKSLDWDVVPEMLTYDCFTLPTELNDSIELDWSKSKAISKNEFFSQINYDLGTFFFYKEEYNLAKKHFSLCLDCFKDSSQINGFDEVDRDMLEVYIKACHGSREMHKGNLLEQLNSSIVNQYMGIITILQHDNVYREIPLMHRLNLEMDVQGAVSSGAFTVARDLLQKIKAFNMVRCILDQKPLYQYSESTLKNVELLLAAIQSSWRAFSQREKRILKDYLLELILSDEIPDLLVQIHSHEEFSDLFDEKELSYIQKMEDSIEIPDSLTKTELILDPNKRRIPQMELRQLERQLITTNDQKDIRELLVKIAFLGTSVWNINPQWVLPIPLQSVLKSIPRGFIKDYAYVTLAKSREHLLNKNYNLSLEFLIILEKELQSMTGLLAKLFKLVTWEILLVQITQLIDQWPKNTIDKNALADACEVCLQTNDSVLPRSEIIEQCAICLLNLARWEFLISFDKRWAPFEITGAIALACQEIVKQKGIKKFSKNLWDIILPIFLMNSSQLKRNPSAFNDNSNMKSNLISVFMKLKDSWCLTVVISLLTKLFNVIKDECNLELQVEYANLWPQVVSNANSYNSVAVSELLAEVVLHGLKEYPTNASWLRLMGDINFANGHYRIALSYYLKSLLIFHDYFNIPIRNDDHVFRRMIKCCTTLGCHTQAAVLCQFLEETDYALAFRILSDQKTCNDAVDAYYHCFWDTSILEYLIHTHHKKGEFKRRKCAVQVIALLELNSSNNEEIQREASNLRKSTFLRALCKQYVF